MTTAHALLDAYRSERGMTFKDLGARLGCKSSMAFLLCVGRRRPGLETAVRIERLTDGWSRGPIRPWQWLAVEETRAA